MNNVYINPLDATRPGTHAAVIASAGTGKTWLLVTRIIRLLLSGVSTEHILSVTFTRKAATEMQSRLRERLYLLASCNISDLKHELEYIGIEVDDDTCIRARLLYQQLLMNPYPLRTTTFHAFCHELLKRFPLEADVPAGFELLETTRHIEEQALDALFNEASLNPGQPLAQALEYLLQRCETLYALRSALREFLNHRSDWWAYTDGQPVDFASRRIRDLLHISSDNVPLQQLDDTELQTALRKFSALLRKNQNKTSLDQAETIERVIENNSLPAETRLHELYHVFFTQKGQPRSRTLSKKFEATLGEAGAAHFLDLNQRLSDWLNRILDELKRHHTFSFSNAWYAAGGRYLHHYQRIKQELRCLDFSDLEWQACQLLNRSDNAHWIQYKLDQKIKHILIDEFQDTNPTQWRLLHPILSEISSSEDEHHRSVFLVGDSKQSIYSFRRANPRLLTTASEWMKSHLAADTYELDASRRSSMAIMDVVNATFASPYILQHMPGFHPHGTCRTSDWGRVEIFPVIPYEKSDPETSSNALRDPLVQPRQDTRQDPNYTDGCRVAEKIAELIARRPLVSAGDSMRPLEYSDILLLIRNRTHAPSYERALRDHHIPYTGIDRGTLLNTLEVQDILALLKILITPYDNLALAQVLRSPIFSLTDSDLVLVAKSPGTIWIEKLYACCEANPSMAMIAYVCEKISCWSQLADRLPVHDLLDHIFYEADVIHRYLESYPPHLHASVVSNLKRLIELALDVDSGRYPSISSFIQRLSLMRAYEDDSADSHMAGASPQHVRLMTVHAAKGLEAPIVFLLDSAHKTSPARSFHTIVDWPAGADVPANFLITGKKSDRDNVSNALLEKMDAMRESEECNLLYVALTRARQMLFITGCEPRHGVDKHSWYALIHDALSSIGHTREDGAIIHTCLTADYDDKSLHEPSPLTPDISIQGMSSPIYPGSEKMGGGSLNTISPSVHSNHQKSDDEYPDGRQRLRGQMIHRMLQLLTEGVTETQIRTAITSQFSATDTMLTDELMNIARHVYTHVDFALLFDPVNYTHAYNEIPLQYSLNGRTVFGFPDRIVVNDLEVLVIDYKTHINANAGNLATLAEPYKQQMELYSAGVERIWPGRKVRPMLLFTQCAACFEFQ